MNTKKITLTAVFTAIVFLVTRLIQIPIPLGYANIGNSIIIIVCLLLPFPYGIFAGSLGSALADLTSYPEWTIFTLIIKAIIPCVFYFIMKFKIMNKTRRLIQTFFAGIVAMALAIPGYIFAGFILQLNLSALLSNELSNSSIQAAWNIAIVQSIGLLSEYITNIVVFIILTSALLLSNLKKIINLDT